MSSEDALQVVAWLLSVVIFPFVTEMLKKVSGRNEAGESRLRGMAVPVNAAVAIGVYALAYAAWGEGGELYHYLAAGMAAAVTGSGAVAGIERRAETQSPLHRSLPTPGRTGAEENEP